LSAGTQYTYNVTAVDLAGNESIQSLPDSATTFAIDPPPSIPARLTATAVSASQINLSWDDSTDAGGITGYNIYRDSGPTPIATTAGTTYRDSGLSPGIRYRYNVTAVDTASNESAQSSTASATTFIDILDQFNAIAYNGNDGTQDWTGGWAELDESDGPTAGRVRVDSNQLHIYGNGSDPFEGAQRIADLTGATTATLSYDYNLVQGNSSRFKVEVSTDGSSWTTLYNSNYQGSDSGTKTHDISSFISATTYVRYWQDEYGDDTDHIYFDNIQIEHD
jgi:chitodextrinase